jgi:hypothetical protein
VSARKARGTTLAGWCLALPLIAGPPSQGTPGSALTDWSFTLQKDGRVQARFKGGRAIPAGPRSFDVENLHVDTFAADGEAQISADSPSCRVVVTNGAFIITSPGPVKIAHADGRFSVEGVGFRWDHGAGRLNVSNRVETVARVQASIPGQKARP